MVKLYISNNRSSRHALEFFNSHQIPYVTISLNSKLTKQDILYILSRNIDDVQKIISTRSQAVKNLEDDFDHLTISSLIKLILNNKSILKTPIIIDDKHFLCGYNREDIRAFLPRKRQIWRFFIYDMSDYSLF